MPKSTIKIKHQPDDLKVKENDTVIFENSGNETVDIVVSNADLLFDGVNSSDLKFSIDPGKSSPEYTVKNKSSQKEFEYTVTTTATSPKIIVQ